MRISDWSSDVCSSDLRAKAAQGCLSRSDTDHVSPTVPCPSFGDVGRKFADQKLIAASLFRCDQAETRCATAHCGFRTFIWADRAVKIGRASCRERVCKYV